MDVFRLAPAVLCLLAALLATIMGGFVGVALACWGTCDSSAVVLFTLGFGAPGAFFTLCYLAFIRVLRGRMPYGTWHGVWAGVCTLILGLGAPLLMWEAIASNLGRLQEGFLLLSSTVVLVAQGLTMGALRRISRADA